MFKVQKKYYVMIKISNEPEVQSNHTLKYNEQKSKQTKKKNQISYNKESFWGLATLEAITALKASSKNEFREWISAASSVLPSYLSGITEFEPARSQVIGTSVRACYETPRYGQTNCCAASHAVICCIWLKCTSSSRPPTQHRGCQIIPLLSAGYSIFPKSSARDEGITGGSNQGSEPWTAAWITECMTLVSLLTNRRPPGSKSRWIKDKFLDGRAGRT